MAPFAGRVQAQLPSLYARLIDAGVDFHLGVVDGDLAGGGRLLKTSDGDAWLSGASANGTARFGELLARSVPNAAPSCAEVALQALSAPRALPDGENAGFRRDDAMLTVLCVSAFTENAVNGVPERLLQVPTREALRFHLIGPVRARAECGEIYGEQSYALAAASGVTAPICDDDWSATLNAVAQAAGPRDASFPLRALPRFGTTAVRVAGAPVPTAAYTVHQWPPLLRFQPSAAPASADVVEVRYTAVCP